MLNNVNTWIMKTNNTGYSMVPGNWEWQMEPSDERNNSVSNNVCNPLQKYAPSTSDSNFHNVPNTSNVSYAHQLTKTRGRERTKDVSNLKGQGHIFDHPEHSKSFPPMKYRSMSCEDARQAVNDSLVKVPSLFQQVLHRRNFHKRIINSLSSIFATH
jgi:hypothetical protein